MWKSGHGAQDREGFQYLLLRPVEASSLPWGAYDRSVVYERVGLPQIYWHPAQVDFEESERFFRTEWEDISLAKITWCWKSDRRRSDSYNRRHSKLAIG